METAINGWPKDNKECGYDTEISKIIHTEIPGNQMHVCCRWGAAGVLTAVRCPRKRKHTELT